MKIPNAPRLKQHFHARIAGMGNSDHAGGSGRGDVAVTTMDAMHCFQTVFSPGYAYGNLWLRRIGRQK
jgi:hypothetical protein